MCCDSWGRKESDTTERLNCTEVSFVYFYFHYSRGWVKKDFAVIYVKEWLFLWFSPGIGDGQGGLACFDSWGRKESDMTDLI